MTVAASRQPHGRPRAAIALCRLLLAVLLAPVGMLQGAVADLSFLVADIKYRQAHGLKICEVQNAITTVFQTDAYLTAGQHYVLRGFVDQCNALPMHKWTVEGQFSDLFFPMVLRAAGWTVCASLRRILQDPRFLKAARRRPDDPAALSSYGALLYVRRDLLGDYEEFRRRYPGVLLVDAAAYPYWNDKLAMASLFMEDDALAPYKAPFRCYPMRYDEDLAQRICSDLPAARYVIKPRSASQGRGVIVVDAPQLDATLRTILDGGRALRRMRDRGYSYWHGASSDSFIVEAFCPSDLLAVARLGGRLYQPTLRVAFLLLCDGGDCRAELLGLYWMTPARPVDGPGSLNLRHKVAMPIRYCAPLDAPLAAALRPTLQAFLPLLHRRMLRAAALP